MSFGLLVIQKMLSPELEHHGAFELSVLGLVDNTHPVFAEFLDNLVVADRKPDYQDDAIVALPSG